MMPSQLDLVILHDNETTHVIEKLTKLRKASEHDTFGITFTSPVENTGQPAISLAKVESKSNDV